MLSTWSRRSVLACAVGWAVLITTYLLLASLGHAALPSPYNGLIIAALSTATIVAAGARFTAYLDERLTEAERRDALLYAQNGRTERRLRLFTDGPTRELVRPHLVAVGHAAAPDETGLPGYARGYVDGLARQPMTEDAKVIPLERSN